LQDSVVLSNEFIPDNRVVNYFSAADVVVQPYKTATQSGVTQIAYHFEKPMIITNVGGLAEFVADGCAGFVVDPDPAAIAEAITRFYREEREHVFIAGVAREKEKYSWKNMIEAIETLLMNMENPFPEEK
jgi:glycosyltransferase involved in cell wall biosynthesis